jgi:hypothetical protein
MTSVVTRRWAFRVMAACFAVAITSVLYLSLIHRDTHTVVHVKPRCAPHCLVVTPSPHETPTERSGRVLIPAVPTTTPSAHPSATQSPQHRPHGSQHPQGHSPSTAPSCDVSGTLQHPVDCLTKAVGA